MFYLEIPLGVVNTLCLTPRKYLLYLGWCILGVDVDVDSLGLALEDADGNLNEIGSDGDVEGGSIYSLVIEGEPGTYSSVSNAERTVRSPWQTLLLLTLRSSSQERPYLPKLQALARDFGKDCCGEINVVCALELRRSGEIAYMSSRISEVLK